MFLAFLVAAICPTGPYPVLVLHGAHGSAKSTTATQVRSLIDPSDAAHSALPRDERDLAISASNSHLISFDNVSGLPPWLSDGICRLATGGGLRTRKLYTDEEEMIFSAKRPFLLNGIGEIAYRPDLLDRLLKLYLFPIDEGSRRDEKTMWREFEAVRPHLLGVLLDGVSTALRNIEHTTLPTLPRMADFALWAVAAAPALGFTKEEFLSAYAENRADTVELALESSPVAQALLDFAGSLPLEGWEGTASELLNTLNQRIPDELRRDRSWPHNGQTLSNAIARVEPPLRVAGVSVERFRQGKLSRRLLKLKNIAKDAPAASALPKGFDFADLWADEQTQSGLATSSEDAIIGKADDGRATMGQAATNNKLCVYRALLAADEADAKSPDPPWESQAGANRAPESLPDGRSMCSMCRSIFGSYSGWRAHIAKGRCLANTQSTKKHRDESSGRA